MKHYYKWIVSTVLLLVLSLGNIYAQEDTTTIQAIEFSDALNKRRSWVNFPTDNKTYRKILISHTLKCDPALISNPTGSGCGEWDAGANIIIHTHEDTVYNRHYVNGDYPDTIAFSNSPVFEYYRSYQYYPVYTNVISESTFSIGIEDTSISHTLNSNLSQSRAQYLYKATELLSAGLSVGDIHKLRLNINSLGSNLQKLSIRIRHTSKDSLSAESYENSGFTKVYDQNTSFITTGVHTLDFAAPFNWDGTSNLLIEFVTTNDISGSAFSIKGEKQAYSCGVSATSADGYYHFDDGDDLYIPSSVFTNLDSAITISLWTYGDPVKNPFNSYLFEALDSAGNRVLSSHLPWGNGKVFWDAGNSGSSYDRIQLQASTSDYEGQWNHWAYTKDVATGEMKLFLNGSLFHSGTNKTRTMKDIHRFVLGGNSTVVGHNYAGHINEFRVFNTALDSNTIQDWLYKDISPSHPNYGNLIAYHRLDDSQALEEIQNKNAQMLGLPQSYQLKGEELFRNLRTHSERPRIKLIQGQYQMYIDSTKIMDSLPKSPMTIIISHQDYKPSDQGLLFKNLDTLMVWAAGYSPIYDHNGNIVDSVPISPDSTVYNRYVASNYRLKKFITPYGNYLDLGPDGFTWIYNITDYAPLLKGMLDFQAGDHRELIDLKIDFIEGTPPRDVLKVDILHDGGAGTYDDIVNYPDLLKYQAYLPASAQAFTIKTTTSGHKFNNATNCAEFCKRMHFLEINGQHKFSWEPWKECGDNAVYPQGGTWIYDRAGWCPGAPVNTYEHHLDGIVSPGNTITVDYGADPDPTGTQYGNYNLMMHLFSYGSANFKTDAELIDIISPNDWEFYGRMNPVCGQAKVIIRNSGSDVLTTVKISYNVKGGSTQVYQWNGNLGFLESKEVLLPITDPNFWLSSNSGSSEFQVTLSLPNGVADQHSINDSKSTSFQVSPTYESPFVFWFNSNSAAYETSWEIVDAFGNTMYSQNNMTNNTLYRDTISLPQGCYTLKVTDIDGDGVSFWANSDGNGSLRWRNMAGLFFKVFDGDFGSSIEHHFTIGYTIDLPELEETAYVSISPNPSNGIIKIDFDGFNSTTVNLDVLNYLGQTLIHHTYHDIKDPDSFMLDLQSLASGSYIIKINDGQKEVSRPLILHD